MYKKINSDEFEEIIKKDFSIEINDPYIIKGLFDYLEKKYNPCLMDETEIRINYKEIKIEENVRNFIINSYIDNKEDPEYEDIYYFFKKLFKSSIIVDEYDIFLVKITEYEKIKKGLI